MKLSQGIGGSAFIKPSASQPFSAGGSLGSETFSNLNLSSGLTVLTLTGRYVVSILSLSNLTTTAADVEIILIVDGRTVISRVYPALATQSFSVFSAAGSTTFQVGAPIKCEQSLSLYVRKAPATAATLTINAIAVE